MSDDGAHVAASSDEVGDPRRALLRLEAAVRALPSAVLLEDERGQVLLANLELARMLELDGPEGLVGRQGVDVARDAAKMFAEPERFRARMEQLIRDGRPVVGEVLELRSGRFVELDFLPIGSGGRPLGLLLHFRDATEYRRIQGRLALSDRIVSLGTMAAGLAHEINNPLSYVLSNVLLAEEALSRVAFRRDAVLEEALYGLREAVMGVERIKNIVRGLSMNAGAADETGPVNVHRSVEWAVAVAANQIRHRARLSRKLAPVAAIWGNETQVGQIVLNLLLNAAQAIEPGRSAENEVHVETGFDDFGDVVILVRDTGCGMTEETRRRVFDPFFTTKRFGENSGLGLFICHNLVSAMGGDIHLESAPGKGTTVRVVLPAAPSQATETERPLQPSTRPAAGKVLVIDDEPVIGRTIDRILRDSCEVTSVTSGRSGLELLLAGSNFDVIVCDLMMPDVTGMELYERVSEVQPETARRILFLTGGAFTTAAEAFLKTVPNVTMRKPFRPEELRAAVANLAAR